MRAWLERRLTLNINSEDLMLCCPCLIFYRIPELPSLQRARFLLYTLLCVFLSSVNFSRYRLWALFDNLFTFLLSVCLTEVCINLVYCIQFILECGFVSLDLLYVIFVCLVSVFLYWFVCIFLVCCFHLCMRKSLFLWFRIMLVLPFGLTTSFFAVV